MSVCVCVVLYQYLGHSDVVNTEVDWVLRKNTHYGGARKGEGGGRGIEKESVKMERLGRSVQSHPLTTCFRH